MVGGARKGYCSKLRLRRVLSPSRTMMIEMTMATMGRRMKNCAMALALRHRDGGRLGGGRTGRHLHPRADFLHALHHDPVAGFQPFVDEPEGADALPRLDHAQLDSVVRLDHGHVVDALELGDRALGDQDRALLLVDGDADAPELAGPDGAPGVREGDLHEDRPGLGIDRAVHEYEIALLGMDRAVGEEQLELEGSGASAAPFLAPPVVRD